MKKILLVLLFLACIFAAARYGHLVIPLPDVLPYGDAIAVYLVLLAAFVGQMAVRPALQRRRTHKEGEPVRFFVFLTIILAVALLPLLGLLIVWEAILLLLPNEALPQILFGSTLAKVLWASVIAYPFAAILVLLPIFSMSMFSANWLMSQYPGYTRQAAARHLFDIQLGIHKAEYLVSKSEIKPMRPAAGMLSILGGPGVLIVEEGYAVITIQSGRIQRIVGTGITFLKPFERPHQLVYLMGRGEKVDVLNVITRDHIRIPKMTLSLFHRLNEGDKSHENGRLPFDDRIIRERVWSPNAGDWRESIKNVADGALRDVVARHPLEEVVSVGASARLDMKGELLAALNAVANNLGVKVLAVDFGSIDLPYEAEQELLSRGLSEVKRHTAMVAAESKHDEAVTVADAERYKKITEADGDHAATLKRAEAERTAAMLLAESERVRHIAEAEALKQTKITVSEGERQAKLNEAEAEKMILLSRGEAEQKVHLLMGAADAKITVWKGESDQKVELMKGEAEQKNYVAMGRAEKQVELWTAEVEKQAMLLKGEAEHTNQLLTGEAIKQVQLLKGEADRQVALWKGEAKADALSREEYARAQGAAERIRQILAAFQQRQMDPKDTSTLVLSVLRENEIRRTRSLAWLEQEAYAAESATDLKAAANDNRNSTEKPD